MSNDDIEASKAPLIEHLAELRTRLVRSFIALAIGLVMALSSTAIVLQTLNEKGLMKSDGGQSSFSVLLTQDIAVIPMLALLPLLAMPELMDMASDTVAHGAEAGHAADSHADEGDHGSTLSLVDGLSGWQTMLVTVGAVAAVILGGSFLTAPIFRFISGVIPTKHYTW